MVGLVEAWTHYLSAGNLGDEAGNNYSEEESQVGAAGKRAKPAEVSGSWLASPLGFLMKSTFWDSFSV